MIMKKMMIMKKILLSYCFVLMLAHICAQPVHLLKDKNYVQHWESMKDCSIREIVTSDYRGVILDGCLLNQIDKALASTIEAIIGQELAESMTINCSIDINEVDTLEHLLRCIRSSDDKEFAITLLNSGSFYRQYMGLSCNENRYLFVSFQRDESIAKNKRIQDDNYALFKLIYSRVFLFKHIDSPAAKHDYFWLLYDTNANTIVSFYYN